MKTLSVVPIQHPVIILAAGLSERMGRSKAFLKWDKHTTFLKKIIQEYSSFGSGKVIVVVNQNGYSQILSDFPAISEYSNIIINPNPEKGRMGSIKLGIKELPANSACYIQNIDNPFVTGEVLNAMNNLIKPDAYVVPTYAEKGGHPVLVSSEIIKEISLIENPDYDLRKILNNFKRIEVKTNDERILVNINTLSDYQKYIKV